MVTIGFEYEESEEINNYLEETNMRFKYNQFISGGVYKFGNKAFLHIKPLVFPVWWFAFLVWFMGLLFNNWDFSFKWFLMGLVPFSLVIFWLPFTYKIILKLGLKKVGYKQVITWL